MTGGREPRRRMAELGWLAYEFANQPYFTLINIFLFASYFANRLAGDVETGQVWWGYTQAAAGVAIALLGPVLGAIADAGGRRKAWIAAFTTTCAAASIALWWAVPGTALWPVMLAVAVAAASVEFVITFANAMLPGIAGGRRLGVLSGVGFGISQLAGILALVLVLVAFQLPGQVAAPLIPDAPLFGLDPTAFENERIVGPVAGLWLALFMVPLLVLTPDAARRRAPAGAAVREGLRQLKATVAGLAGYGNVVRFLVARMLYNDGVQAVFAFGGVIAGAVLGWGALELALFGIVVTLAAAVGGFAGAAIDARIGSRRTIAASLAVVCGATLALVSFQPDRVLFVIELAPRGANASAFTSPVEWLFIALACLFGLAVGPVTASSRTLMARLAPPDMVTEFFGLYALSGKATAFAAPLAVALVTLASGSRQAGLATILVFLIAGLVLLLTVRDPSPGAAEGRGVAA